MAIDAEDNLYLFSRGNPSVAVLEPTGKVATAWGDGVFTLPHGIFVAQNGAVWCVDDGDHTVRAVHPGRPLGADAWNTGRALRHRLRRP